MPFVEEVIFLGLYFEDCIKIMLLADIKTSLLYVAFICRQAQKIFQIHGRSIKQPPAFVQSDSTSMMVNVSRPLC
jgi:hypothetical protein